MNHLRLLLRRRAMVSLAYSEADGLVCGEVAMEIVRDIQAHAMEMMGENDYRAFRFHMAVSLGGSILILATLLCRDLTVINLHDRRAVYTESYSTGLNSLRRLAVGLHCAGRILHDLRDIADVVELVIQTGGPTLLENGDSIPVVPPNIDDLFPYGTVDLGPYMNVDCADSYIDPGGIIGPEGLGSTVGDADNPILWDLRDKELLGASVELGVPWV